MLIIGHRGAKGLAPENTLASFDAALRAGIDAIEFDIRTTKDSVPVVFHDASIVNGVIDQTDYKQLRDSKDDLITLDQAMRHLRGKTKVIIEIKPGADITPVITCLKEHLRSSWDISDIKVASFSQDILKNIKKEIKDVDLVVNEKWSGVRASHRARQLGTKYITMNQRWLWSGFIKSVASSGYKLSAYTVNDPAQAKKWQKHGLHAVITDYPDRLSS